MGFSGGGSNVTKAHTHDSTVLQDGGALAANVTQFGLTNGSILYSDGSNIQELSVGAGAQVLGVSGSLPAWITNTSNPLIKVSKTYADIVVGTTSMDIYTLPQDAALVNIWTDITTVFDVSTSVSIGDAGDDNGFTEATDWTSGTGLTDATRGVYITSFKTMRSTSGTTAIEAYNFTTAGTEFEQLTGSGTRGMSNGGTREEFAQQFNAGHTLIGETVSSVSFFMENGGGSPTGNVQAFLRQSDGTIKSTSPDTVDASTITTNAEYSFSFTSGDREIDIDDMLSLTLDNGTGGVSNQINTVQNNTTSGSNQTLFQAATPGSSYVEITSEMMKFSVTYGTITSDTQGAVDFYLQVVD